jgi:hypothetical protein
MFHLSAIRDFNHDDPLPQLGAKVERGLGQNLTPADPVGIITGADGKMRTNLPLPPELAEPMPAREPDRDGYAAGCAPAVVPLKVGDRVRFTGNGRTGGVVAIRGHFFDLIMDHQLVVGIGTEYEGTTWERA